MQVRRVLIAALVIASSVTVTLPAQGYRDDMRPNILGGVVLSVAPLRQSHDIPTVAARIVRERIGQLFAAGGFEAIGAETPYNLQTIVTAPPTREDTASGINRSVAVVTEVNMQLTYAHNGMVIKEWTLTLPGTGRDRVEAIDNAFRALRTNISRYVDIAREARDLVLRHVESTCDEMHTRVSAHIAAGRTEQAIAQLLLVPDEARRCHASSLADAATLLQAKFGDTPPNDDVLKKARGQATAPGRDPARHEWPLLAGAEMATKFVNEHKRGSERGERIW
jgi:hypothetical protein